MLSYLCFMALCIKESLMLAHETLNDKEMSNRGDKDYLAMNLRPLRI